MKTAITPIPQIDSNAGRAAQIATESMAKPAGKPPSAVHCSQSVCASFTIAPASNVANAGYTAGQQPNPQPVNGCTAIICSVEIANWRRPAVNAPKANLSDVASYPTIKTSAAV